MGVNGSGSGPLSSARGLTKVVGELTAVDGIDFTVARGEAFGSASSRRWQDFDLVNLALQPMFLFSGMFLPITVYPNALRVVIQLTRWITAPT